MSDRKNDPLPYPRSDHDDGGWGPWFRQNITKENVRFALEMLILAVGALGLQQGCAANKEAQNNSVKIEQVEKSTNEKIEQESEKTRRTVTGMRNPLDPLDPKAKAGPIIGGPDKEDQP